MKKKISFIIFFIYAFGVQGHSNRRQAQNKTKTSLAMQRSITKCGERLKSFFNQKRGTIYRIDIYLGKYVIEFSYPGGKFRLDNGYCFASFEIKELPYLVIHP